MAVKRSEAKPLYELVSLKDEKQMMKNENNADLPNFGKRHMQVLILFLSLSIVITMRAHMSVTVVAMTDQEVALDVGEMEQTDIINPNENITNINNNNKHLSNTAQLILDTSIFYDKKLSTNNTSEIIETYNNDKGDVSETDVDNLNINGDDPADTTPKMTQTLITEGPTVNTFNNSIYKNHTYNKSKTIQKWSVFRIYDWSKSTQEMITGSFFVGYTSMQLPMGIIAQRFGGKTPILVGLFVNAVVSIITPWIAIFGWWAVCSCRLLQGMTQAAFYPGIHTILGKWAPANERGRLSTYIYTGSQFGTILAFQMAGFLAGTPSLGWPSTFWVCGLMSFGCFILFWYLGAASPAEHSTISEAEKQYIMGHDDEEKYESKRTTPWRSILTSVPVWAMIATHAGSAFGYLFLLIEIPVYMNHVLHVDIKNNGLFSSLPYIAMYISSIASGHGIDYVINRGFISVINARRLANSIGMVLCAILMLAFAYAKSVPVAVTLLVLCMATHSGVQVGFLVNQIDLTPNFAGTIMSLGNLVANFVGLAVPVLVSVIVVDVENQSQWQIVIWITAAIMIISNTIYIVFLKVEVQPWNDIDNVDGVSKKFQYEKIGIVINASSDKQERSEEQVKLQLELREQIKLSPTLVSRQT